MGAVGGVGLSQDAVDAFDYVVMGVAGALLLVSIFGALFAACNARSKERRPAAAEFNYLWRVRVLSQVRRFFATLHAMHIAA